MRSGNSGKNEPLVCDTGPLLALGRVGFLHILLQLFAPCLVTDIVCTECLAKPGFPDAAAVQCALEAEWLGVVPAPALRAELQELDGGEATTLEVALRRKAVVLLDEKRGREIARRSGIRVIGSLGAILLAKQRGRISAVMPCVTSLNASGYYLSPQLIEQCRTLVGE